MRKYTISQHFDGNLTKEIIASSEEDALEQFEQWSDGLSIIELHEALDLVDDDIEITAIETVQFGGEREYDDCYGDYLYDQWKDEVLMDMRK